MKPELRRPLLDALSWKLRLPKGNRENPLHTLTSTLTAVLPQTGMGEAWEVIKAVFGHVVDTMVDPTLTRDEYMAKVRYSFERAWDHRETKEAKHEALVKFFNPDEGSTDEWRSELLTVKDKEGEPSGVRACTANIDLILEHDENFRGFIQFNDLRRRVEITGGPLKSEKGAGTAALSLSNWLQTSEYSVHVDRMTCGAAILHAAKRHHFNPVEQYLLSLKWDGKPRCARVLLDYCEAQGNTEYLQDITRKFFISAAARALSPGCKVDTVLVLQGIQGTRKTSFVETLAGEWYTTVGNKFTDKDTQMQSTAAWFVEMSELASLSRGTNSHLRGYLTKRFDPIRVPYAEQHEDYERRCVFVGTTNDDQPLIDPDGNRRYWVVACGEINLRALAAQRDQIWAEAVHLFRQYEDEMKRGVSETEMQHRWWFTRPEQDMADLENSLFQAENPIEDDIQNWLRSPKKKPDAVTCAQLAKAALFYTSERLASDDTILSRIGKTLTAMGWKKVRRGSEKVGKGGRFWAFELPRDSET
jgi:putative DNA primase/helicase